MYETYQTEKNINLRLKETSFRRGINRSSGVVVSATGYVLRFQLGTLSILLERGITPIITRVSVEDRDSEERLHNPWPPPSNHYIEPEEDQSNQIYQPHGPQATRVLHQPSSLHACTHLPDYSSEYSPRRVTGSLARPRGHPRITTGLYHTSQWGTARIPYRGAVVKVPVVGESHKTHKGTVTTTILSRRQASTRFSQGIPDIRATSADNQQQFHSNRLHNTLVNGKVRFASTVNVAGYAVQDASVEDQVCVRCPVDRTVVASRGTDFVFMPHSKLKKCKHRPKVPGAKWEYLYGPRPGSIISEGSHVVAGRALYNHKQLQQCQYRYTVLVRKCPPLMLPKYVDAHCSRGNVWGSECELVCQQGYQLRGHNLTACGDQLMWTNPLPQCSVMTDCPLPMSPSHGRLSCHTPDGSVSSDLLPEGSVCRYMCDEGYSVPESESHLLVTMCTAAEWNSTADPSCQSTQQYYNYNHNTQPQVGQYQRDAVHHTVRVRHRAHAHAVTHR
uniref:Sushi domain-containing protein n=1 Tax=Timema monikensis TaxID=170555 RepID=A0A7R9EFB1_9NEOP|nr:unnamed protein product [Timema monikensis]